MKLSRNTVISLILFTILVATLMGLEEFFEGELSGEGVVEEVGVYLVILLLLLLTVVTPMYRLIKKFNQSMTWKDQFLKRIAFQFTIVVLISAFWGFIFGQFIHHFIDHSLETVTVLLRTFIFLLIITGLIVSILEILLLSEDRERFKQLTERLEKENVESLYSALKNQVNPHFLFNSLSVLSSLIYFDVKKADQFIQHFSKVYRYVLELKDESLVLLNRELDLLNSYIFLQQIRFGEMLQIKMDVPSEHLQLHLPPLALQMALENAIKHNKISRSDPLEINVEVQKEKVIISNNLSPRSAPSSTSIGLENLKERYRVFTMFIPTFENDGKLYIAELPLIDNHE